jgi:threonine/homoserine/homoserine lactone efflux protein
VKLAGAAYLIAIGIARLVRRHAPSAPDALPTGRSLRRIYLQAVVVNVLNPKTALFFVAFLPQFVNAERGHPSVQIALLGVVFAALGVASDSSYAFTAARLGAWLRGRPSFQRWRDRVTGGVYVALGAVAASARSAS